MERDCRYVGRVRRGREERGILRWMMRVKKQVDGEFGVGGVLPWGSEVKGETRGVGAEWVRRIARGLRKRWGGDVEAEVGGWFEVWEGVIVNRCTGWVVEPEHLGLASLEDDDEVFATAAAAVGDAH